MTVQHLADRVASDTAEPRPRTLNLLHVQ